MEKKLYRLYDGGPVAMWETSPLVYHRNHDGITITAGSLVNTGFTSSYESGITLPCEIDGIPVTELRGRYSQREIGFIESTTLKRVYLEIVDSRWGSYSDHEGMVCKQPTLVAGCQNTIEEMQLKFVGKNLALGSFGENDFLTSIVFDGKILPHYDWESDYIDDRAFQNNRKLRQITGEMKAMWLSDCVFDGCESLVQLPDIRVEGIFSYAFRNCRALSQIHLHNGLKSIGYGAFENCESLKDIYIPDTVTRFESYVFKNCRGLQTLHLPDGLTTIEKGMFYGCCALKKAFLSNKLKGIKDEAFYDCSSMASPWIPNGLEVIGARAFWGCVSMKTIYLPESVQSIGENAFGNCGDLTIRGSVDSYAQKYALENNIPFEVV